jgi:hypothetical protein
MKHKHLEKEKIVRELILDRNKRMEELEAQIF